MWPYRHVFRAAHATQRNGGGTRRTRRARSANATQHTRYSARIATHSRTLCDTSSSAAAAAAAYRRPRRICTLDILIHSLIHTDYIIGLYHADRPRDWRRGDPPSRSDLADNYRDAEARARFFTDHRKNLILMGKVTRVAIA